SPGRDGQRGAQEQGCSPGSHANPRRRRTPGRREGTGSIRIGHRLLGPVVRLLWWTSSCWWQPACRMGPEGGPGEAGAGVGHGGEHRERGRLGFAPDRSPSGSRGYASGERQSAAGPGVTPAGGGEEEGGDGLAMNVPLVATVHRAIL